MSASPTESTSDQLAQLLTIGATTVYEGSGEEWWIEPRIRPAWRGARLVGPAYTAKTGVGDNLAIQHALREAPAGSVLVVDAGDGAFGYWGGIMTEIASLRGLAGLVIYGTVRDIDEIESIGFPVFATGIAMRHAKKSDPGTVGKPISLAGRNVETGDIVVADADGVVVIPRRDVTSALINAQARFERERVRIATIKGGSVPAILGDAPALV
jgi:4-hydroxy-4-methyl-2-oxoglutarate aldolase